MDNVLYETANLCYNHLGGLLGETLLKFFLKEELIKMINDEYKVTDKGWKELEGIGVDTDKLRSIKGKLVTICIESDHGIFYEHIGSYLGNLLMEKILELGWIEKKDENRFELTEKGLTSLESMGIKIRTL